MGILGQGGEVGDTVIAGAGGEHVAKGQRRQGRVSAGAAAADSQSVSVGEMLMDEVQGSVGAIVHIDDAPVAVEQLTICPPVANAAAVVDVDYGESARGPILNGQVQRAGRGPGRSAVAQGQQRGQRAFRGSVLGVARGIIPGVGRTAVC